MKTLDQLLMEYDSVGLQIKQLLAEIEIYQRAAVLSESYSPANAEACEGWHQAHTKEIEVADLQIQHQRLFQEIQQHYSRRKSCVG